MELRKDGGKGGGGGGGKGEREEHTGLEWKRKWEQAAPELVSGEDRQDLPATAANPRYADVIGHSKLLC